MSVCLTDPGFATDLLVTADIAAYYQLWLGRREFGDVIRTGQVQLDGPPALVQAFPKWLAYSLAADAVRSKRYAEIETG